MPQQLRMASQQTYQHTLRHAVALVGGDSYLAARLHVRLSNLRRWLRGADSIPDLVFLQAIDIIVDAYGAHEAH